VLRYATVSFGHVEPLILDWRYNMQPQSSYLRMLAATQSFVFFQLPDDLVLEWSGRMLSTAGLCSCKLIRKPEPIRTARIILSSKVGRQRIEDAFILENMCLWETSYCNVLFLHLFLFFRSLILLIGFETHSSMNCVMPLFGF